MLELSTGLSTGKWLSAWFSANKMAKISCCGKPMTLNNFSIILVKFCKLLVIFWKKNQIAQSHVLSVTFQSISQLVLQKDFLLCFEVKPRQLALLKSIALLVWKIGKYYSAVKATSLAGKGQSYPAKQSLARAVIKGKQSGNYPTTKRNVSKMRPTNSQR